MSFKFTTSAKAQIFDIESAQPPVKYNMHIYIVECSLKKRILKGKLLKTYKVGESERAKWHFISRGSCEFLLDLFVPVKFASEKNRWAQSQNKYEFIQFANWVNVLN